MRNMIQKNKTIFYLDQISKLIDRKNSKCAIRESLESEVNKSDLIFKHANSIMPIAIKNMEEINKIIN